MNSKSVCNCLALAISIAPCACASAQPADAVRTKQRETGQMTYVLNLSNKVMLVTSPDLALNSASVLRTGMPLPSSTSTDVADGLNGPTGMAVDSKGYLYIANSGNNTIMKYWCLPGRENLPYRKTTVFAEKTGVDKPTFLAFDTSDNLYVANSGNNSIEKFTPDGDGTLFTHTPVGAITGMTCDNTGNLYVANGDTHAVTILAKDDVTTQVVPPKPNYTPAALTFDSNNNLFVLFVVNNVTSIIEKYPPSGRASRFASLDFAGPYQMAFDSSGILDVLCTGARLIVKIRPNGKDWSYQLDPRGDENPAFRFGTSFAVAAGHVIPGSVPPTREDTAAR